jgi:Kef-type K+ transport system membrane component KefB
MSQFLQLLFLLSIILIAAKVSGYVSIRLGQPSVLGELLAGIILGPSLLNVIGLPFLEHEMAEVVHLLGELGVLLLMFIAGLELNMTELRDTMRVAAVSGFMGVITPLLLGWGAGMLFGMEQNAAIFLGLTLGATSVSISAQTLIELRVLRTRVGLSLLGAAVFDDILVILFLSIFLALVSTGGGGAAGVLITVVRMGGFLLASAAFGVWVLPWVMRRISHLPIGESVMTISLLVMFFYGITAEVAGGMAAITGSFIAGLMLARTPEKDRIEAGTHTLAYALFVPIFFVNIGLSINLKEFQTEALLFTLVVTLAAIAGKWIGAGLGGRLTGLSNVESVQLGAGMISRGEVGLIVASVGMQQGLMNNNQFSAIIVMILVTTLVTPPILRWLFARSGGSAGKKPRWLKQTRAKSEANAHSEAS